MKCGCNGEWCYLDKNDPRHGSINGYGNLSCRCEPCRAANSEYLGKAKARRVARGAPDHVHGTANGYGNWGCRCRACTDAWTADCIERRQRYAQGQTLVQRGLMAKPKRRVSK